jgi:hypothetical protein
MIKCEVHLTSVMLVFSRPGKITFLGFPRMDLLQMPYRLSVPFGYSDSLVLFHQVVSSHEDDFYTD